MAEAVTLKQIHDLAMALNNCGVATLGDLKKCIAKDPDEGIRWVTTKSESSQPLLVSLLIAEIADDSDASDDRPLIYCWRPLQPFSSVLSQSTAEIKELWAQTGRRALWQAREPVWAVLRQSVVRPKRRLGNWKRHWLDALLFLVLPGLLLGFAIRAHAINKRVIGYVAVKRESSIPAFQRINGEVELRSDPASKGAFTNIDQVSGRYTLVNIPAGKILQSDQLLSPELSARMHNRRILSIPIKYGAYNSTITLPTEAILVLSPRQPDLKVTTPLSFQVIVLTLQSIGDSRAAIIAIDRDNFDTAASLLASHDAFLSQPLP